MLYIMDINSVPSEVEVLAVKYRKSFYKNIEENSTRKIKDADRVSANDALRIFLYNCMLASACGKSFAISLDEHTYSKPPIRNGRQLRRKCSYTYTSKILRYMASIGLISYELGKIDTWSSKTEFTTIPTIVTLTHEFSEMCRDIEVSQKTYLQINCLILRDQNKNPIKFSQGVYQKEKITMVSNYNLRAIETEVKKGNGNSYLLQLRKIYNEDFKHGGRLYDLSVQNMNKRERRLLTIGGESVKLLDYKAFETSIAYTLCEEKLVGDPYTIEFEEYSPQTIRDVCKLIMTRIFNCENKRTLSYLVNEHIRENFNLAQMVEDKLLPEKRIPVGLFIDILIQKHEAIQDFFFCSGEVNLQHAGSEVMDYVIEKVMQNHKGIVVPVFDEVVCPLSLVDCVKTYMEDAYEVVLGSKVNCCVVVDE